jgi:hypothetical protein
MKIEYRGLEIVNFEGSQKFYEIEFLERQNRRFLTALKISDFGASKR